MKIPQERTMNGNYSPEMRPTGKDTGGRSTGKLSPIREKNPGIPGERDHPGFSRTHEPAVSRTSGETVADRKIRNHIPVLKPNRLQREMPSMNSGRIHGV
jgi:hypothetical protein